jgi:hypothetical protein
MFGLHCGVISFPLQLNTLYFAILLMLFSKSPDVWKLLTFHFNFIFRSLGHSKESVKGRGPCILFYNMLVLRFRVVNPSPVSRLGGLPPCLLSVTAYSVCSQLPSISESIVHTIEGARRNLSVYLIRTGWLLPEWNSNSVLPSECELCALLFW